MTIKYDVIIIGAGAAGMMCAIEAGKRGRKVILVDHSKKLEKKLEFQEGADVTLLILIPSLVNLFQKTQNLLNQP